MLEVFVTTVSESCTYTLVFSPQLNTYQAALAWNGSHAYAMFNYEHDGLQWSGNAVIGYMSADQQFFYNHPLSQTAAVVNVSSSVNASNTGITGQLVYLLSGDGRQYINQTVGTINSTATESTSKTY